MDRDVDGLRMLSTRSRRMQSMNHHEPGPRDFTQPLAVTVVEGLVKLLWCHGLSIGTLLESVSTGLGSVYRPTTLKKSVMVSK